MFGLVLIKQTDLFAYLVGSVGPDMIIELFGIEQEDREKEGGVPSVL